MIRYAKPTIVDEALALLGEGALAHSCRRHRFLSGARQQAVSRKCPRHQRSRRTAWYCRNREPLGHRRTHHLDRSCPPSLAGGFRCAEAGGARSRLGADPERRVHRRQSLQRLSGRRRRAALACARRRGRTAFGSRRHVTLPLEQFILGNRRTELRPGEMVTAIRVPKHAAAGTSAFVKLGARRYLVISIAMVAARLVVEDGIVGDAAVAVGSCSAVAKRLAGVEAALRGLPANACAGRRGPVRADGRAVRRSAMCAAAPNTGCDAAREIVARAVLGACRPRGRQRMVAA